MSGLSECLRLLHQDPSLKVAFSSLHTPRSVLEGMYFVIANSFESKACRGKHSP